MLVRLSPVWLSASVRLVSKRCWFGGELWLEDWLWLGVLLLGSRRCWFGGERWLGDWLWLGCGRHGRECACGRGVRSRAGVAGAASVPISDGKLRGPGFRGVRP